MKITDDMLYHHAEAAREKWLSETLPPQIPEHKFSGKFDRKMRKLIREQRHSAQFNRHIKLLRRIAAVFLLVCTISFGCVMTVDAYREKIIETVVRVFNELTDYRFSKSADMPESIAYAFPPTLSYIPDGMIKAEENAGEQLYTVTYEGEDGNFFDLSCTIFTDETQTEKSSTPKMCNRPSLSCMEKRQRFSARTELQPSSGLMTMCCITCTVQFQLMNCVMLQKTSHNVNRVLSRINSNRINEAKAEAVLGFPTNWSKITRM